jgi:hypothetical protein
MAIGSDVLEIVAFGRPELARLVEVDDCARAVDIDFDG